MLGDQLRRRMRQPVGQADLLGTRILNTARNRSLRVAGVLDVMALALLNHPISPARKSLVFALGPASKTVIRPWPEIQYCHSSAFGCQCISRIPPGATVTRAAAIVLEILKVELSAIRMRPPLILFDRVLSRPSGKMKGFRGSPPEATAAWSAASGPGSVPWNIHRFFSGTYLKGSLGTPKFCSRTSGGVCAIQSVRSSVLFSDCVAPVEGENELAHPPGPRPCNECGKPAGKYHRSPLAHVLDVGTALGIERGDPASPRSCMAHSAARCQCIRGCRPGRGACSRQKPPSAIAKSDCVT